MESASPAFSLSPELENQRPRRLPSPLIDEEQPRSPRLCRMATPSASPAPSLLLCTSRMSGSEAEELSELAVRLREVATKVSDPEIAEPLERLTTASIAVGEAWSGSPIGYHARVYYADFAPPPAGAHFSSEWGFSEALSNYTAGDWREYTYRDVVDHIRRLAGSPDLTNVKAASLRARETLNDGKPDAASLLTAALAMHDDPLLAEVKTDAAKVLAGTEQQYRQAILPSGQVMSRDMRAMTDGLVVAPHFAVQAEVLALKAPFDACGELAVLAQRGATHLNRVSSGRRAPAIPSGTAVVIGHGRSLAWRELKDFVDERLDLPWDEFNRVPVAGMTNIARLSEMLDNAVIALLVLTAEDEMADGSVAARQNVIHEVGLFQGRLGFTRAIVLLEEGCAEFSNIEGLGQIRFPAGKIGATFEEVRRVMEREGLVDP